MGMRMGSQLPTLFYYFFIYSAFSSILTAAQSQSGLELGFKISAGSKDKAWVSSSGDFAFGFRPLLDQENRFLLAIWFNKIPEQTIVWYWYRNDYVLKGSTIQLTKDGLVLSDPEGSEKWRAQTTGRNQATVRAAMLDSGNFVLINDDGEYIWESFNEPTDTILPGQTLRAGKNLTSRQSDTDYSDGRFMLGMQADRNLVLYTVFNPTEFLGRAYWASGTQVNPLDENSSLVFDEAPGYMYIKSGSGKNVYNVTNRVSGSGQDYYYLARLDMDGVFRLYSRTKGNSALVNQACSNSAWSVVKTKPDDVCTAITEELGSGACGYNSYCENSDGFPTCSCPDEYSYIDSLNPHKGCKPKFPIPSCQTGGWESNIDAVDFKELNNTNWPLSDYEVQKGPDVDKERCKEFCRQDCFCVAAIYNMNDSCFKKKFPLSNGRRAKDLIGLALIKVPKTNGTSYCPPIKDRSTLIIVISALLGSSLFINLLLLGSLLAAIFFAKRFDLMRLFLAPSMHGLRRYTYKELVEATGGFKQQLGRGSFGTVFKGAIGSTYIAVKRLDGVEKENEREFTTEVRAIGQTHHRNLVSLLGYCEEGPHRLLVYEYMSNKSLANFLFSSVARPHWRRRMHIALGVARGLGYLHEDCNTQIIHCDVKPANILLDDAFVPKISDFGLAKLLLSGQSRIMRTQARGTVGYFAPEWFRRASVTTKVDVYSFGIVLLELVCCTSCVAFGMQEGEEALVEWAYKCYKERKIEALVENDEEALGDMAGVERAVMVAIWCVQEEPSLRPSMRRVVHMLEGVVEVTVPPRPVAFSQYSD